ncbi:HDOD domain-containing protein [Paucibacter sp. APW11]|uniref:HDOD domain-containing protein n=1 Tax=Roseateles aquae TaxID=3077235 RepID=A0ABU3P7D0_9BURK|nr:HDOD domain-containing protein [Paucibacter sp. APW11]MDT8998459.1 HDOD domain-containing protein [Paucibacter sp. APW11]
MSASSPSSPAPAPAASAAPMRRFGRFELRALLGKSARSMLWLVFDSRHGQEMLLSMPREKPNSEEALAHWLKMAQAGARVQHPNLAHVVEVSRVEMWPYIAYDRALGETLDERLQKQNAPTPLDAADWVCQLLEGLAFAHEAGHAHRDIQCAHVLINAANQVRLVGLEVAQEVFPASADFNTVTRRAVRESSEEDVLCVGLILHRLLTGRAVLEQTDLQAAVQQMQPLGRELVRLSWETPHPIAEPLRAIANRATDRQARQRYHLARSFHRALDGWRTAAAYEQGGPIALLMDKMQRAGHLPSSSTKLARIAQSSALEAQHASELSTLVLQDMALSLELLRRVNNALKQQGGSGTVLNLQRAIAMLGLNGLQQATRAIKPWPGPLGEVQAELLKSLMRRVHRAGVIARTLRPAGYDAEVVYLICLLQNLGRLLLQYHFPDDAQQVRQLMQPAEPTEDNPNPVGMSEQAAAYAVLGCDVEAFGLAVARHWSLGEEVMHMMHRQSPDAPVRAGDSDAELLRLTCSLANELVDAQLLPEHKRQQAVELAARRYSRALGLGLRDVMHALHPELASRDSEPALPDRAAAAAELMDEPSFSSEPLMSGQSAAQMTSDLAMPESPAAPIPSPLRARLGAQPPSPKPTTRGTP